MGYTQYFFKIDDSIDFTKSEILEFGKNVKKIIQKSGIKIKGPDGLGEPIINEKEVSFNGDASKSEDYETFSVSNDTWGVCKTNRKAYDKVVVASIIAAKKVFKNKIKVGSDAHNINDVNEGIKLFIEAIDDDNVNINVDEYLKDLNFS